MGIAIQRSHADSGVCRWPWVDGGLDTIMLDGDDAIARRTCKQHIILLRRCRRSFGGTEAYMAIQPSRTIRTSDVTTNCEIELFTLTVQVVESLRSIPNCTLFFRGRLLSIRTQSCSHQDSFQKSFIIIRCWRKKFPPRKLPSASCNMLLAQSSCFEIPG